MNIQQSYREAAVRGASPVQLVILLYEQMIQDLRQVASAIEHDDIQLRTASIKHAILVLGYLQSGLDFERGGKVAQNLENFYNASRERLVGVQFRPAQRAATQLITDLLALRAAWIEVEQAERPSSAGSAAGAMFPSADNDSDSSRPRMNWQG